MKVKHAKRIVVKLPDDSEFLRCIELVTKVLSPGGSIEVVAPLFLVMWPWEVEKCKEQGIRFEAEAPLGSLSDLPPGRAARMQRELLELRDRWADRPATPGQGDRQR